MRCDTQFEIRQISTPSDEGRKIRLGLLRCAVVSALLSVALCCPVGLARAQTAVPLPGVTQNFAELFERITYRPDGAAETESYEAFLYRPRNVTAGTKFPLVIWLHGAGDDEFDHPLGPLKYIPTACQTQFEEPEKHPFFLLVPHCPRDEGVWYSPGGSEGDMLSRVDWLLDKILRENPIQADRVSVVGISSGGRACWEWVARQPERFAAVAPLASGALDLGRLTATGGTPIWAFAKESDGDIGLRVQASADVVNQYGGNAHATLLVGSDHHAWTPAFAEFDLFAWLLRKSRNDPRQYLPPGYSPVLWPWNYAVHQAGSIVLVVGLVLLGGICFREFKRRSLQLKTAGTSDALPHDVCEGDPNDPVCIATVTKPIEGTVPHESSD